MLDSFLPDRTSSKDHTELNLQNYLMDSELIMKKEREKKLEIPILEFEEHSSLTLLLGQSSP